MKEFTLVPTISEDGIVRTNAKELLEQIVPELKKYNYIVSEENLSDAKEDRKNLNKLVKTVTAERKKIEDAVFGEWKKEKADIMSLEKEIQKYSDNLTKGINDVEYVEKMQKKAQIEEYWYTLTNKYPFELVFDERYLNKTASTKAIEDDLKKKLKRAIENEHMMETFLPADPVMAEHVKDTYYSTMDLAQAKAKADELARLASKIAEEKEKPAIPAEEPKKEVKVGTDDYIYCATFSVEGTFDDMRDLSQELVQLFKKYHIEAKVEKKWKKRGKNYGSH